MNSDRIGTLKALGITLLLFVALGPVVQPWYLSWGLILLAPVALGRLRSLIIGLSMVTAFIELPGGTQLVNSLIHGDPLLIVLTLLWILVVLTVPLATWDRAGRSPRWPTDRRPSPPPRLPRPRSGGRPASADAGSSRRPAQSRRWRTATSSQRLNFRPTSRSTPTRVEPAGLVEGDGGRVVPADPGDDRVEAVLGGQARPAPRAAPGPRPRPGGRRPT